MQIREATIEDAQMLFEWQTHPDTRRYFFNSDAPSWETHLDWLQQSLQSPTRKLLIGEKSSPIGILRYDIEKQTALVSVYLKPGVTGQGLGSELLQVGNIWIKNNLPNVTKLFAEIVPNNIASQKAFEKAGYKLEHMLYQFRL